MNAVYFEKHGGAEVLKFGARPDPVPTAGEVLVDIKACALNHLDIWVRGGMPGAAIPLPHIPGSDVSGLMNGKRVIVSAGQLPARCYPEFEGRDSYSPDFQILGLQSQGGYAQKVCVPAHTVIPVSEKYSFEEWAALPLAGVTAYHMLITRAQLKAGETVLIHAAGSGIGSYAIQIAKSLGAKVFTTVGDPAKVSRAKEIGADEVILYKNEDFAEKARKLTGGRGVDVVFEHIGPEVFQASLAALSRGGRLVTCGATSGAKVEFDLRPFYSKQVSVLGSYMGSLAELKKVVAMAEAGTIRPVLDEVFPLEKAADAQRRMEARRNFGKIILKCYNT